jgi:hypothetical protein
MVIINLAAGQISIKLGAKVQILHRQLHVRLAAMQ